jgi:Uncharacterized protein SCO1/SenC/PrrC, involved in biogenesis of respiratory and photosynthetic systems
MTFALVLAAVAFGWWIGQQGQVAGRPNALRDFGPAPQFSGFRNQLGQKVDSSAFAGKVQLVTFLFPYCTGFCPLIALHLVGLETELRSAGLANQVQLLAFNVDPTHTGPKQAAAFLKEYGWDPKDLRFQFLTGSAAATSRVVRDGYHVYYQQVSDTAEDADEKSEKANGSYIPQPTVANPLAAKVKPDYDVAHNDSLALVGPHGHLRWINTEADRLTNHHLIELIRDALRHPA